MTVSQLSDKYLEFFGEPTRSRNRTYLIRKLSWRIQELAEAGLSKKSLSRIQALSLFAPARWRLGLDTSALKRPVMPKSKPQLNKVESDPKPTKVRVMPRPKFKKASSEGEPISPPTKRDPRLPAVGTVLRRECHGEVHEVRVGETDFEYRGVRYLSLSKVASEISGSRWNGFAFFRLKSSRGANS